MLVTLGVPKIKAAVVTVVGNAINVGFGAMAIPTTTAGKLGGADPVVVAGDMGHLTWVFCVFIPSSCCCASSCSWRPRAGWAPTCRTDPLRLLSQRAPKDSRLSGPPLIAAHVALPVGSQQMNDSVTPR